MSESYNDSGVLRPRLGSVTTGPPATVRRLERAISRLAGDAIDRMDETLPWYGAMPPDQRSWVGLVAQAGIAAFIEWFRDPGPEPAITADVFGTAPRELARAVTLQQTVELIRVTIAVVEDDVAELAAPGDEQVLREAVLRYSREIAFAAAQVYAQAAEARGAWDARLEALVVDALLRGEVDEPVRSRASALGWGQRGRVAVIVGRARDAAPDAIAEGVQRAARTTGLDAISAVHGERLVVAVDGLQDVDALKPARHFTTQFAPGPGRGRAGRGRPHRRSDVRRRGRRRAARGRRLAVGTAPGGRRPAAPRARPRRRPDGTRPGWSREGYAP